MHKDRLFAQCKDMQEYSHCQKHYLMKVDMRKGICKSYRSASYLHDTTYSGITLIHHLKLSQKELFENHLKQWEGPVSTVLFIEQNELKSAASLIMKHNRTNLIYSLYILPKEPSPPYRIIKGERREYASPLYPINELRDLGIESIMTTHYLLLDLSVTLADNTYQAIQKNKVQLSNYKNILLLPILQQSNQIQLLFNQDKKANKSELLPRTKEQLLKNRAMYDFSFLINQFSMDAAREWVEKKDSQAFEVELNGVIEPNGVYRRSALNPIFHPYFFEDRKDRFFLWRLKRERDLCGVV
ncbi:hypothetical protein WA577_007669 [Blastocystis sp. JDR]